MSRREMSLGLLLALVLRVGFTVHAYRKDVQPTPTGKYEYEPIARGLLLSGVYSDPPGGVPTARREPGYILFVALIYKLFTTHRMYVFLTQCVLSTLTAGILYGLAARLYSPFVGRFSFWACVLYPYFIYYAGYFFREDLLAFLLVLLLYILVRWKGPWATLGAGFLGGWLCLANGAWAPACLWTVLALSLTGSLKRAAAFGFPVMLMIGIWAGRNWMVFHEVIPFSSNVGGEIYIGMTIPYEVLGTEEQTRRLRADETFQAIQKLDGEVAIHKGYMAAAKAYVLAHPAKFLATMAEHGLKLWRPLPHNRAYTHSYLVVALTALASDGWLLPLALFGFWVKRRDEWARWYFAPMVALVTASFSISQAPIRYRVPLMIILLMLAGAGLEELLRRRRLA